MPSDRGGPPRRLMVVGVVAAVFIVALFARPLADEQTPWEFFRASAARTDTAGKVAALFFFTTVLMWMNLMAALVRVRLGLLLPIVLVALAVLAAVNAQVRRSRLVRVGFGLLVAGVLPLAAVGTFGTDNPVGLGFLFAFLTPIAALLIVTGTILALTADRSPERQ